MTRPAGTEGAAAEGWGRAPPTNGDGFARVTAAATGTMGGLDPRVTGEAAPLAGLLSQDVTEVAER